MLTHKRVVVASLVVTMVLASLMSMSSVRATTYEAPPYDDKWTLASGSNYPYADANLSTGRLEVWMMPLITESSTAEVKIWKRVWLPATALKITCSWRLDGSLRCALWLSFTGVDLKLFVEKSINSGTINETTLFDKYVDGAFDYSEEIDTPWESPAPIVVSIPEAGYYNIGADLAGEAGGLLANCIFGAFSGYGAWVSMKLEEYNYLSISTTSGGTTNPAPGTYTYGYGSSVAVTAIPNTGYKFNYWNLDGATVYGNPVTVTMNSDHALKACFSPSYQNCPTLFVWNGSGYVDYGVINIHDPSGEDVIREVPIQSEDVCMNSYKAKFRLREGWEGLNYSESVIDQVKLYAVDSQGNRYLCPLISANHSSLGNVLPQLLLSDDWKAKALLLETIDLTFIVPYQNIESFTFVIEGCNVIKR